MKSSNKHIQPITINIDAAFKGKVAYQYNCISCGDEGYIIATMNTPKSLICTHCFDEHGISIRLSLKETTIWKHLDT